MKKNVCVLMEVFYQKSKRLGPKLQCYVIELMTTKIMPHGQE